MMLNTGYRDRRHAFTLIELLIVLGVIALLAALLFPAVSSIRRQAKVTQCASNLRQICAAMHAYAVDNKGKFPDMTLPGTGANLWDVSHFFTQEMRRLGVDFRTYLCPASQIDRSVALADFTTYSNFNIIQYNIWVPHLNGGRLDPPPLTGGAFVLVSPPPTMSFAGPADVSDMSEFQNPIITDLVASGGGATPPANADPSVYGNPYQIAFNSNHGDGTRIVGVNWGFVDGHVEFHLGNEVHPYYLGNWWNWR
jgi:prepilin-type N-terminal cleavage/methylation domain-containing protein/prepilin-type processing-associated H-X9-DG protein